MSKKGVDWELEQLTEKWLKENDNTPVKQKTYKSERQMKRKSIQECPISNLSKKKASEMENKYYGIITGEDNQC